MNMLRGTRSALSSVSARCTFGPTGWLDWCVSYGRWLAMQVAADGSLCRSYRLDGSAVDTSVNDGIHAAAFLARLAAATGDECYLAAAQVGEIGRIRRGRFPRRRAACAARAAPGRRGIPVQAAECIGRGRAALGSEDDAHLVDDVEPPGQVGHDSLAWAKMYLMSGPGRKCCCSAAGLWP